MNETSEALDYVVIGSGFGGSVSAMRLVEKGYSVLVLERGKRFRDADFAKTNWRVWKYLWLPPLRCFGILQITPFRNVVVLHGCGVGGGSLGYANVLMEPDGRLFDAPAWRDLADWKTILKPHYETAKRMLGVVRNPKLWPADHVLEGIAGELGAATPSGRPTWARSSAPRARMFLTPTSAARGRPAPAANSAAVAWWGAGTTPRTRR